MTERVRGARGRPGTASTRSRSRAGRAPRWPRSSSPACAGETVLCPSNTFMATPLAALHAGARVEFVDCNRDDLCLSFADLEAKVARHRPRAVILVHIGGHIAFEVERIAELCRARGHLPDRGLRARARRRRGTAAGPGTWGDAGVWSFYATKTISTGEGGMLVSRHPELLDVRARVPQLRQARPRRRGAELPPERVHRGARDRADRAHGGDRRVEERGRPRAPRPGPSRPPASCPTA